MRLPKLPPDTLPEMHEIEATVSALSHPASSGWCMARIYALLNSYYDKDTPPLVRQMEAEDWMVSIAPFPQWAIERAVRWWKSADNSDRRKRPLEGDIAARCRVEMRGITALPELLSRKAQGRYIETQEPRPSLSAEERREIAARVCASVGFGVRKFGGQGNE